MKLLPRSTRVRHYWLAPGRTRSMRQRCAGVAAIGAICAFMLAACGESKQSTSDGHSGGTTAVSLALDYTPNAEHNGLAAAMEEGYFADAGIKVKILPYGATSSDALVSSGQADFGLTFAASTAIRDWASGLPVKSVMVLYQHTPYKLGVLASGDVRSPKDLAGGTYGGFGNPQEPKYVDIAIKTDGGAKPVKAITLGTSAFQAVASGKVDSAFFYPGDLYEADQKGKDIRTFTLSDYGVPDSYGALLLGNDTFLRSQPKVARKFVQAMQKGYEFAMSHPDRANADLLKVFDGVDAKATDYVSHIQNSDLYPDRQGGFGSQDMETWQSTADHLAELGLLEDADGKPVTKLDVSKFVDNSLVSGS